MEKSNYEVAIIGGGSGGLSAALSLGRSCRKTIVFDTANPRNRFAEHAQNFFTRDGTPPLELMKIGREQLSKYSSVSFREDKVVGAAHKNGSFQLFTGDGQKVMARKIILATGVVDVMPDIKGFGQLWGTKIIHCPYCHGWEIMDRKVALLFNGAAANHMAILINNWNKDLQVFTNGPSTIEPQDAELLISMGIRVVETPITELVDDQRGVLIRLKDGGSEHFGAIYSKGERLKFNNELAIELGCKISEEGSVITNDMSATSVPGVYAVGDLSHPGMHQVVIAAAGGTRAGAACNYAMIMEDHELRKEKALSK